MVRHCRTGFGITRNPWNPTTPRADPPADLPPRSRAGDRSPQSDRTARAQFASLPAGPTCRNQTNSRPRIHLARPRSLQRNHSDRPTGAHRRGCRDPARRLSDNDPRDLHELPSSRAPILGKRRRGLRTPTHRRLVQESFERRARKARSSCAQATVEVAETRSHRWVTMSSSRSSTTASSASASRRVRSRASQPGANASRTSRCSTTERARTCESESSRSGPALQASHGLGRRLRRRTGKIFKDFDVVLAPTTAAPPLEANASKGSAAGSPTGSTSAPALWPGPGTSRLAGNQCPGRIRRRLPVGAQLLGQAGAKTV